MSSSLHSAPAGPTHRAANSSNVSGATPRAVPVPVETESPAASASAAPSQSSSAVRPFAGAIREDPAGRNPAPGIADADNTPAVRLLNDTLREATRRNASDLHIEPAEQGWRMRLRIDGVLHALAQPPAHLRDAFITRVKVLARMDIAERRIPQDGRLRIATTPGRPHCSVRSSYCVGSTRYPRRSRSIRSGSIPASAVHSRQPSARHMDWCLLPVQRAAARRFPCTASCRC
jgi:type IV pilus assembly protein PilB